MDPQVNKAKTVEAVDAFNRGDIEAYLASYATDVVIHGLPSSLPPTLDGHRRFVEGLRSGLPDVAVVIHELVAENDLVALRMTYTGTHLGPLRGIAPSGRHVSWDGMTFRRFRPDALTVERWILGDTLSLVAQLEASA
jgi:steroid delta-isomerase-like uncharacterized protein